MAATSQTVSKRVHKGRIASFKIFLKCLHFERQPVVRANEGLTLVWRLLDESCPLRYEAVSLCVWKLISDKR